MLSREDKHCCRQPSSGWHFVTATTGNQRTDRTQPAHFAQGTTRRLRRQSVRSHLTRSRFVAREQTVDRPQDTERVTSSRTTEGDFRASQNVSDFTLSIHATYCTSIELFTKKKGMFKRERTCDLMILNSVTLLGGIGTRSSLARPRLVLSVPCVPGHTAAQRGRQCQAPPLTFPKRCDTSMSGRAWVHPEICGAQNHRD